MDGQSTPLTPQDRLGDDLASLKSRISELERAFASSVVPVAKAGDTMTGALDAPGLSIDGDPVVFTTGDGFLQMGQEIGVTPSVDGRLTITYPEAFDAAAVTLFEVRINTTVIVTAWMVSRTPTEFVIEIDRGGSPWTGSTEVNWIAAGPRVPPAPPTSPVLLGNGGNRLLGNGGLLLLGNP